jgi:hypothetical protein
MIVPGSLDGGVIVEPPRETAVVGETEVLVVGTALSGSARRWSCARASLPRISIRGRWSGNCVATGSRRDPQV